MRTKIASLSPSAAATLCAVVVCAGLLVAGTVSRVDRYGPRPWKQLTRRFWEDTYLAVGHHLTGRFPVSYPATRGFTSPEGVRGFEEVMPTLTGAAREAEIRGWEFWRTVPTEIFQRGNKDPRLFPRYDDGGRPLLLSLAYGILGGVSPFLIFWLGVLCAIPVAAWVAYEMHRAGRWRAGIAFLLLVGLSPFVADVLALVYSALGFYIVAALGVVAFGAYAVLGTPSPKGLVARAALAGLVLGVSSVCRASAFVLVPGLFAAWLVAAFRMPRARGALALAALLLVLPYLALARGINHLIATTVAEASAGKEVPPPVHPVWHGLWIGLGDFDRTKGYVWNDQAAFAAIVAAGGTPSSTTYYDPRNETIARDLILGDIAGDPLWFASILAKRTFAALTQWKLRPWGPTSGGVSIAPAATANEGYADEYYKLATTVDRIGVGGANVELPLPVLILPTAALVFVWARKRRAGAIDEARGLAGPLLLLGCVATALLVHPVLLTTASALETEAFALTYLLGAAFAIELLLDQPRFRRTNSS